MNLQAKQRQAIVEWLSHLPPRMPINAIHRPIESDEVERLIVSQQLADYPIAVALLWLRVGEIDVPHGMVQDSKTDVGSYLHGVVHRMEGDYWNAKYWFRQVRDKRWLDSLGKLICSGIDDGLAASSDSLGLTSNGVFQPTVFVDACEEANSKRAKAQPEVLDALGKIGLAEWLVLWEVCFPESGTE